MIRKIFGIFILLLLVILLGQTGLALKSLKNLYVGIITNQPAGFDRDYQALRKKIKPWGGALNLIDLIPEITGRNSPKTYYVLLQNNMELRPTGGFMGSYAKMKFENGGMGEIIVQDIYVPDGQIAGHVDPPVPIQMAFKQGWFRLRDANWDPDFPTSAQTVSWFFEKGNEEKAEGMIAVNLNLVEDLFDLIGPIDLVDYGLKVDSENFYQIAQEYAEKDFFAGSTQKANIMSALVKAMISKLKNLNSKQLLVLAKVIYKNLQERQVLIYLSDPKSADIVKKLGWDGSMKKFTPSEKGLNDYFYLVEANLGVNKANLYVQRKVEQEMVILDTNSIQKRTKIYFKNESKYFTPVKPGFWGGDYVNFLRVYFPSSAREISVNIDGKGIGEKELFFEEKKDLNLQGVGFFVEVPAKSEKEVTVVYKMPVDFLLGKKTDYILTVQKQPGIEQFPYKLTIPGFVFEKQLRRDTEIKAKILYN